ncbi:MAG: 4-alpha-glucanotransferase [Chitinivibrionales bacterium]|nr:4-alpha-glucanotransferase [Chitinivibrionales bacterium]
MDRGSGILLHISSLPSEFGIGDLGRNAFAFADRLVEAGQKFWQVLPLNPTNHGMGNSPYFSSCVSAGNPLLVDLHELAAQDLLNKNHLARAEMPSAEHIDFAGVYAKKMPLLPIAAAALSRHPVLMDEFARFCTEQKSWLEDFALFAALKGAFGDVAWNKWPDGLKFRKADALLSATEEFKEEIELAKRLQFLFFRQWFAFRNYCNQKGIRIIGDIPIYVSYDSVDVWANRQIFKLDEDLLPYAVSGVPPDYFSETGQLWNTPVYNWDALEKDRYAWWVRRMEGVFARFDIVRIDHFRGLVQYWEVPAGEDTAMNGAWKEVPTYDFFDVMIEKFPGFPIIAEDLGMITDDVNEAIAHYQFPGMKVLIFAFGEDNPQHPYLPHNFERNAIVYTGTHDNTTFKAWFEDESTDEDRERLFAYIGMTLDTADACWEAIRLAHASVADVSILPVQDLLVLGAEARMNQPAVAHGNWKWQLLPEQFDKIPFDKLRAFTEIYGRV